MDTRTREQARAALLDAGLQLWADGGWPAVTLARAAAAAGTTAADFAEEFPSDIDLTCGIFDDIVNERASSMITAIAEAPPSMAQRLRACLAAMVDDVGADRRRAVVLAEPIGCPELLARRRSANRGFAGMVVTQNAETRAEPEDLLAAGHYCLGGLGELVFAWLDPASPVDRDLVIEHGVRLFEACVRIR
ncbi:hypothetical protein [Pseudonocardia sp. KRD291]|uniref:hypothetical protein n=1 Tax=Pseudonocardia sp. KRD291 TaxID=2792007 RepID=UPI001C4A3403|nr:hypothetical protein [Pseudonocardia sp. KRD291]MBW0104640.1 hypothetical protein [Pseudonocardia sp. KRD291]